MWRRSQSTTTNAQPVRSNSRLSWATISSSVRRSHSPSVAMSVGVVIVLVGDLLEQLERRDLGRGGADLAAAQVLQLREERRVDGDLLRARVLQHDDGPAGPFGWLLGVPVLERGAGGGEHGDGELAPVRD